MRFCKSCFFSLFVALLAASITSHAASWPGDARVAVALTFDLDADTLWWDDPQAASGDPGAVSQGTYGPDIALPKILDLLARHNVKATFFVPAWVAENYPAAVRSIALSGHELGAHGDRHVSAVQLSPAEEARVLQKSIRVLENFTKRHPVGYRAPSWAVSEVSLQLAADNRFMYSSNLMDADLPYIHDIPQGLVELPVSWVLDDAPYFWFDEGSWNKKIHSAADVMAIWQEEFAAAHADKSYLMLTMHPQIIGRPARIRMLDEFLTWMKTYHGVWLTNCASIAQHVLDNPAEFQRKPSR